LALYTARNSKTHTTKRGNIIKGYADYNRFVGGKTGEFTAEIRNTIKGIQYGSLPDPKGWLVRVL